MRISLALFCATCVLSVPVGAGIHKCVTDQGTVYQDRPCDGGTAVVVKDGAYSSGAGLRASERRWLRERAGESAPKPRAAKPSGARSDKQAQARRCWQRKTRLEAVKARLRRGYKPSQGDRLRRQRRNHEDYLSRFCG